MKALLQLLAERAERLASMPTGSSGYREAARRLEETMREVQRELDAQERGGGRC